MIAGMDERGRDGMFTVKLASGIDREFATWRKAHDAAMAEARRIATSIGGRVEDASNYVYVWDATDRRIATTIITTGR